MLDALIPILLLLGVVALLYVIVSLIAMMGAKKTDEKLSVLKAVYIYTVSFLSLALFLIGFGTFVYSTLTVTMFSKVVEHNLDYQLEQCDYADKINYVRLAEGPDGVIEKEPVMASEQERAACRDEVISVYYQENLLFSLILMIIGLPVYLSHFIYLRRTI